MLELIGGELKISSDVLEIARELSTLIPNLDYNPDRTREGFYLTVAEYKLGSMFSRHFIRYGYFIILAFALLMFHFYLSVLRDNLKKKGFGKYMGVVGFIGVALIFLFFGIQSPQVPFRNYFLGFGVIIVLYGLWGWFRK